MKLEKTFHDEIQQFLKLNSLVIKVIPWTACLAKTLEKLILYFVYFALVKTSKNKSLLCLAKTKKRKFLLCQLSLDKNK